MELVTDHISILETPSEKGQDFVAQSKRSNGDLWYIVCDGHGSNKVIDHLRTIDLCSIMENENPARLITESVEKLGDTFNSGATMTIVIISPKSIRCLWCGDSTLKIWADGHEIYSTKNHNSDNPEEVKRMQDMNIETNESWCIKVLDDNSLTMEKSNYYLLDSISQDGKTKLYDKLNMTSSLGHNGKTGTHIEEATIIMQPGIYYTMVAATDGLWDMVHKDDNINTMVSATELTEFSLRRWCQEWCYKFPGYEDQYTKIQNSKDDIGVATWRGSVKIVL